MSGQQKMNWVAAAGVILSLMLAVASASSWAVARGIGDKELALEARVDRMEIAVSQMTSIAARTDTKVDGLVSAHESDEEKLQEIRQMLFSHVERGNK